MRPTFKNSSLIRCLVGVAFLLSVAACADLPSAPFAPAANSASKAPVSATTAGAVYQTDFANGAGVEWSAARLTTSPSGERFLGEFSNDSVTLSLSALPAHGSMTITFDVYAIRSWDRSGTASGGDEFSVSLGNQVLAAGSLAGPFAGAREHSHNALGYTANGWAWDKVLRLTYTVSHSASTASLRFAAKGLQDISDESWGIDNVVVTVKP